MVHPLTQVCHLPVGPSGKGWSGTAPAATAAVQRASPSEPEPEEGFEVAEQIEEVVGHMLEGLQDKDTVVRWSAAKVQTTSQALSSGVCDPMP